MKLKNPSVSLLIIPAIIAGCAATENFNKKMDRYSPSLTKDNNLVPEIYVSEFTFTTPGTPLSPKRAPASNSKTEYRPTEDKAEDLLYSNKKLYFLTLLDQYEKLKNYSKTYNGPSLTTCPNFHTGMLTHYEKFGRNENKLSPHFSYQKDQLQNAEYLSLHPELMLPLTKDSITPKVVDIVKSKQIINENEMSELMNNALQIHLAKTYGELTELCEYGQSDNYYIYENLITHINTKGLKSSPQNLNILLKTTLFSNLAIIESLKKTDDEKNAFNAQPKRGPASIKSSNYTQLFLTKLKIEWANQYFEKLSK